MTDILELCPDCKAYYYAIGDRECPGCRYYNLNKKLEETEPDNTNKSQKYKGYKDRYTGYYGREWPEIRKEILERDNYECQDCGITHKEAKNDNSLWPKNGGLHIHHIKKSYKFDTYEEANNPENLIALCGKCHKNRE